jgi:hypothetical protein
MFRRAMTRLTAANPSAAAGSSEGTTSTTTGTSTSASASSSSATGATNSYAAKKSQGNLKLEHRLDSGRGLPVFRPAGPTPLDLFLTRVLPAIAVSFFAFAAYYTWTWSEEHNGKNGGKICVNCNRQKEIADEIYGGKVDMKRRVGSVLG